MREKTRKSDHELANASLMSISSSRNAQDDGEAKTRFFFFFQKKKMLKHDKTSKQTLAAHQMINSKQMPRSKSTKHAKKDEKKKMKKTYVRETCKRECTLVNAPSLKKRKAKSREKKKFKKKSISCF
jgi:hypothetical protein